MSVRLLRVFAASTAGIGSRGVTPTVLEQSPHSLPHYPNNRRGAA